jgi:hypothetical protein
MTRERLEGLPMTVLLELSEKENLSIDPEILRDDLIEELLEAYEDDRRERETLQNLILKIEQAKFDTPTASSQPFVQDPVLPASYDDNSVSFVLRDPAWALVLWEVRKKDLDTWTQDASFRGLSLKVLEYLSPDTPSVASFPIPVAQGAGSRYLHLPTPGRWYALELVGQTERESRVLARSPLLRTPPELPDNPKDRPDLTATQMRLLELSGSALCETAKETETVPDYPQRIGAWEDASFLEAE